MPLRSQWACAPPRSSWLICSPVTARITSGPVMYMLLTPSTIRMKSVIAGEYTAPPAQGPRMTENWGMTPELRVLARKILA